MNPRRLYRSHDRQLAGVAGGMAEYLDIDPTVVRIAWIVIGIASVGFAILAYLLLAIVIPNAPYPVAATGWYGPAAGGAPTPTTGAYQAPGTYQAQGAYQGAGTYQGPGAYPGWAVPPAAPTWSAQTSAQPGRQSSSRGIGLAAIIGVVLVVVGGIALADVLVPGLRANVVIGPAIVIVLGVGLLAASVRRDPSPVPATMGTESTATSASAANPTPSAIPVSESAAGALVADPDLEQTRVDPLVPPTAADDETSTGPA